MPSSIIHRCVSKRILEKKNLFNDDKSIFLYEIGSIAPDSWKNSSRFKNSPLPKKEKRKYSHFSLDGEFVEHYETFYNKYKDTFANPFMLGYLVHLITDNYWRTTMFYNCFDIDGSVKLLDGSTVNGEKGIRKELLHQESKKMSFLLSKYFRLGNLENISIDEINQLPKLTEIEFDGINDTINYSNFEASRDSEHELLVYKVEDFVSGIDKCSDFIINKLIEYDLIKK